MLKRIFVLLLPILMLTSCSKRIEIQTYADVDYLPHGFVRGTSFFVFINPNINNALLNKEVIKKTSRILKNKGYKVKDKKSAEYYLLINYGQETKKRTIHVPVSVGQTHVSTIGNAYGSASGNAYGNGSASSVHYSANGSANISGFTTATQTAFVPQEINVFNKTVLLQVYDAEKYRDLEKEELIWQGAACNFDEDGDLRDSLDYLFVSAFEYFGKNTQKSIQLKINTGDRKVKNIRKAYAQDPQKVQKSKQKRGFAQYAQKTKDNIAEFGANIKNKFNKLFPTT